MAFPTECFVPALHPVTFHTGTGLREMLPVQQCHLRLVYLRQYATNDAGMSLNIIVIDKYWRINYLAVTTLFSGSKSDV